MRRPFAAGCCALYLVFGFVSGLGHVHAESHERHQSRGLHLDHHHLGDRGAHHHGDAAPGEVHGSRSGSPAGPSGEPEPDRGARSADHPGADALKLGADAVRSAAPMPRTTPALVTVTIPLPERGPSERCEEATSPIPRAPPKKAPARLRAPPA